MINTQNLGFSLTLAPKDINGAAATCTAIDTLGYNQCDLIFMSGVIGAADFDAALTCTECETSGGSYTAITGASLTAPVQTDDGLIWQMSIKMQGRMRYLKPVIDAGAVSSLFACVAILSKPNQTPNSVTERGVKAFVAV